MPKITFIGAGSTVFARNLLGDILGLPRAARVGRSRCSTSTPSGSTTSELVARRVADALGRARRDRVARPIAARALDGADYAINMIQVGGYEPAPSPTSRSRRSSACARRSPTRSASAGSCAACARSRCCSTCARDMEELCPDVVVPQLHEPDGDQLLGDQPRDARSGPSACATACRAPRASCRPISASRIDEIDYLCAGINHMAFYLQVRARRRGPLPADPAGARRGRRVPDGQPRALRDAASASATSSPSRASTSPSTCRGSSSATGPDLIEQFNIPLDEYPRRCDRADRRSGTRSARELRERRARSRCSASFEYARARSSAASRPASRASIYGNVAEHTA